MVEGETEVEDVGKSVQTQVPPEGPVDDVQTQVSWISYFSSATPLYRFRPCLPKSRDKIQPPPRLSPDRSPLCSRTDFTHQSQRFPRLNSGSSRPDFKFSGDLYLGDLMVQILVLRVEDRLVVVEDCKGKDNYFIRKGSEFCR